MINKDLNISKPDYYIGNYHKPVTEASRNPVYNGDMVSLSMNFE